MTKFYQFAKNDSGATAIEYGLLASLIAVAIIVGAGMVGTELDSSFQSISKKL